MSIRTTTLGAVAFALVSHGLAAAQALDNDPEIIALRERPITGEEFDLVLEEPDAVKVDELVARLSGPEWAARERAAAELIEIGAPAFTKLREAYLRAEDLESRLRIEEVVRSAYLNHHVLSRHGFLGISMQPFDPALVQTRNQPGNALGNIKLPPGRVGVLVRQVISDTGAAKADVRVNDILIGLNGTPVSGEGRDIQESFSAIIREHPPGSKIQVEIVRGEEVITIEAVLGRPPENVARNSNIIKVTPLYHAVAGRFGRWWEKFFLAPNREVAAPSDG